MSLYTYNYRVDETNLEASIRWYMPIEGEEIFFYEVIEGTEDTHMVIHFGAGQVNGVAFLTKGINGKFQFRDVYYTDEQMLFVSYEIEGEKYGVIMGRGDSFITEVTLKSSSASQTFAIYDNRIFIMEKDMPWWKEAEIHYRPDSGKAVEEVVIGGKVESLTSGSKHLIPIGCFIILAIAFLITRPIKSRIKIIGNDKLYGEDQRIKQRQKPW